MTNLSRRDFLKVALTAALSPLAKYVPKKQEWWQVSIDVSNDYIGWDTSCALTDNEIVSVVSVSEGKITCVRKATDKEERYFRESFA